MPKKLTYEFVKYKFEEKKYELLSKEYVDCTTKLLYICDMGHEHSISWGNFKAGWGCPYCTKKIKPTIEQITTAIESEGYKIVSLNYINSASKIETLCPREHLYVTTWNRWTHPDKYRCKDCSVLNRGGKNSSLWKGGVRQFNIPLYETYAPQLEKYQPVYNIEQGNLNLLGVECAFCKKIFVPKEASVRHRVEAINGRTGGEHNFYCSHNCKKACPTYGQKLWPKGFKPATYREVQPELRKMVLARDNYKCVKCGSILEAAELHCHHIDPVINNPIESADIDNCITLCKGCHKQVHKLPGCIYQELKCN